MKTQEILKNIRECGGFDNWRNWSRWEVADWVQANYDCSRYVALKVAEHLI